VAAPLIFICEGGCSPQGMRNESTMWGLGRSPGRGLKHFADIVYRFRLQKRSKFKTVEQRTHWYLSSLFHGGG